MNLESEFIPWESDISYVEWYNSPEQKQARANRDAEKRSPITIKIEPTAPESPEPPQLAQDTV